MDPFTIAAIGAVTGNALMGDFNAQNSARSQRNALALGSREAAIEQNKDIVANFKARRAMLGLGGGDVERGLASQPALAQEGRLSEQDYLKQLVDKLSPQLNIGGKGGVTVGMNPIKGGFVNVGGNKGIGGNFNPVTGAVGGQIGDAKVGFDPIGGLVTGNFVEVTVPKVKKPTLTIGGSSWSF